MSVIGHCGHLEVEFQEWARRKMARSRPRVGSATCCRVVEWSAHPLTDLRENGILQPFSARRGSGCNAVERNGASLLAGVRGSAACAWPIAAQCGCRGPYGTEVDIETLRNNGRYRMNNSPSQYSPNDAALE